MSDDAVTQVMASPSADSVELSLIVARFDSDTIANPFAHRFSQAGGMIGRAEDSTLVLADFPPFRISGAHCRIAFTDGEFVAIDESRNGTFLNDPARRVSRSRGTQLMHGDVLLVGPYEILVVLMSRERKMALRREAEAAGQEAILAGREPGTGGDVDRSVAAAAAQLTGFADMVSRLLKAKDSSLAALGGDGAGGEIQGRDDQSVIDADRRELINLLLRRPGPKGPQRSIDQILDGLYAHQDALAVSAWAGPQSLTRRWTPASIGRRCDRQFRFTGPESLDRKKKCMELFEADFTIPDPVVPTAPAEGEAPPPPPPPIFSPQEFASKKSIRAYNRVLNARIAGLAACDGWPPPLPAQLLTLTLVRIGGKPAGNEIAPLRLLGEGGSIGRSNTATMSLPDPNRLLTRNHVEIEFTGAHYVAYDRSKNGTFINARRHKIDAVTGHILADGEHLLLGDYELSVAISGGAFANAFASQLGGTLVDGLAQACGLTRTDLPNLEAREVFSILAWRLRMLAEWRNRLDEGRRLIYGRFAGKPAAEGAESADNTILADLVARQQEAVVRATGEAVSEVVTKSNPRRFLEAIDKKTIYRADTFWGEVFQGKQRIEAWGTFVEEQKSANAKSGGSYFCDKFVEILGN
jgi:predicted component of type VI protein secretion system